MFLYYNDVLFSIHQIDDQKVQWLQAYVAIVIGNWNILKELIVLNIPKVSE